jgi:hypothetical protein
MKRKTTLLHRGYLYAQKKIVQRPMANVAVPISEERLKHAGTWRAGYVAAVLDARRAKSR